MATQLPPSPDAGVVHQGAQAAIAAELTRVLQTSAWPEFDPQNIEGSLPRLSRLVQALVRQYGLASARQAVSFYRQQRSAAAPGRLPTVPLAAPPTVEQVEAEMKWATSGVWGTPTPDDLQTARDKVAAAAERMALDMGRDTIVEAVQTDRQAKAWARVTEPGACSFCLLLATRGAVYQRGDFQAHDNCRCHVEPLFGDSYEPTAQVRAAQQLYAQSTKGLSGARARNAFRKAVAAQRAAGSPLA